MAKKLDKIILNQCKLEDVSLEEIEWLWEVKETTPFLNWLAEYVDNANCVNERHYQRFLDWCADGMELCGKDLDQALQEHGIEVPKYLSSDLSLIEIELNDKELDELRLQNDLALELESLLSDEIQKLILNEEAFEVKLKASQAACQKEGQNLMKINVPLKAIITNLFGNFLKLISSLKDVEDPDIKNGLLSNMPLETTINTCLKFNEYANLCLKRKFEQLLHYEMHSVAELMSFLDQEKSMRTSLSSSNNIGSELPKKMWKIAISRISVQGTLCGYTAAMQHLAKFKENVLFEKYTAMQMKIEVATLQDAILRLSDDFELILKHEVANMAEDSVLCDIFPVVENMTMHRIERRKLRLRELCSVSTITHKFLCLTDLAWMLLTNESRWLRFGTELLKEITGFFTDELAKHKATMDGLNNINNDYNLFNDGQRSGQASFVGAVQRLLDIITDDSDSGNGTLSENQATELDYIQLSDLLEPFEMRHAGRENSIFELLSELTNGPTRKPSLVKEELALAMQKLETQFKKCNADADDIANTFSSTQLAFKKSPVSQIRRLLWAWFLVAPDQLEKALKLAKELKKKK